MKKSVTEYTNDDKKILLVTMMSKIVQVCFSNHLYRWNGEVRQQAKGGPKGLRGTGVFAKIVMYDWLSKFR